MKIDVDQLNLNLARQCKSLHDLRSNFSPSTLTKIKNGENVRPKTVGKVARALGIDPEDIIEKGA